MIYNWQQNDWSNFTYDLSSIEADLLLFREKIGQVNGMLQGLSDTIQMEVILSTMIAEAIKTSEIEGEYISRPDVVSSIRNNLGLNSKIENVKDNRAKGISELMIDIRNTYNDRLSEEKLFNWHKMLMKGNHYINAGIWRSNDEPMQVISGAFGKEKIHFEAPPSNQVPIEMKNFIHWFNSTSPTGEQTMRYAPVRSAIAHLYFESIHPFEDGNGRIGRAIAEKALSQSVGKPVLLSLSQTIEADKKNYYQSLEQAQKSNEITEWIQYFVEVIVKAQQTAEEQISFALKKAKFFGKFERQLNERQLKVIQRMLEFNPDGFEGGMNARKYVSLTKASKATATRDLQELAKIGAIKSIGAGRSTRYEVVL